MEEGEGGIGEGVKRMEGEREDRRWSERDGGRRAEGKTAAIFPSLHDSARSLSLSNGFFIFYFVVI